MQVGERLAKSSGSRWFLDKSSVCHISEAGDNVLARPLTYLVHANAHALRAAMKVRRMGIQDVVVLTYSTELEFGSMRLVDGGKTTGHLALEPIFDLLQTEEFSRLQIGISHPDNMAYNPDVLLTHEFDRSKYQSFFLCNKFSQDEQFALDKIILPAAEQLLQTGVHDVSHMYTYKEMMTIVNKIKKENMQKTEYEKLQRAQFEEYQKMIGQTNL